jgi:hypothetical protein
VNFLALPRLRGTKLVLSVTESITERFDQATIQGMTTDATSVTACGPNGSQSLPTATAFRACMGIGDGQLKDYSSQKNLKQRQALK